MSNPRKSKWLLRAASSVTFLCLIMTSGVSRADWLVWDKHVETKVDDTNKKLDKLNTQIDDYRNKEVKPQFNKAGNRYGPVTANDSSSGEKYKLFADMADSRGDGDGADSICGGTGGTSFSGKDIWKLPTIPATADSTTLNTLSNNVCRQIVAAENQRFQEVITMMKRIKKRNEELKKIADARADDMPIGALDASSNNLQVFMADSQVEIQYSQATIAAYDSLIANLKLAQNKIGQIAVSSEQNGGEQTIRLAALTGTLAAFSLF